MLVPVLLVLNILVCIALVAVVLLQRSEGGALGMGGGNSGFMTARGAGNLLTQVTWGLGITFFVLSLALTLLSGRGGPSSVVDRAKVAPMDMKKLDQPPAAPAGQPQPAPAPDPAAPDLNNPFGLPGAPPAK
jgi:preprotein translocase subunit SecG